MNIVVNTSNDYLPYLKVYTYLFNRFWSDQKEVMIVGFDEPQFSIPENFKFISLGKQRGIKFWHDDLIRTTDLIEDDFFIQMPENEFIIHTVRHDIKENLYKYLSPNIGRIDLTPGVSTRESDILESNSDYNIIESKQNENWRVSMRASIWNKNYFKSHLKPGAPMTHFEVVGSMNAKNDNKRIIGSDKEFVCRILDGAQAGRHGNFTPKMTVDLRAIDNVVSHYNYRLDEGVIDDMKSIGIIKESNVLPKLLEILT
jgi:hypothetical protein